MKLYKALACLTATAVLSTSCAEAPKPDTPLPFTLVHYIDDWMHGVVFDFEQERFYNTGHCRFYTEDQKIDDRLCARLFEFSSERKGSKANHEFLHTPVEGWPADYELKDAAPMRSGEKLLTFSHVGLVFIWNIQTKELEGVLETNRDLENAFQKGLRGYAISSDDKHIATAMGNENGLQIWDIDTLENVHTITSANGRSIFDSVKFSPDGSKVAAMQSDNTLGIWDVTTGENLHVFGTADRKFGDFQRTLQFSSDGHSVMFRSKANFEVWDVMSGRQLSTIKLSRAFEAAISPDGTKVVAAGGEPDAPRQISIYDAATGQSRVRLPVDSPAAGELGGFRYIDALMFSPDGKHVVSSIDKKLQFWDVETGQLSYTGPKVSSELYFSPDGSEMGLVDFDQRRIHVYDLLSEN